MKIFIYSEIFLNYFVCIALKVCIILLLFLSNNVLFDVYLRNLYGGIFNEYFL